jgi:hypothetical protein
MNAFFGGIQSITRLRRDALGEHETVHTCNWRPLQSKSTIQKASRINQSSNIAMPPKAGEYFKPR